MKIKVKDLLPNPFRNLDRFPIDREKVKELKKLINKDGFLDNIVVRKSADGKYEIQYGHHRVVVLEKLGWEEKKIDIPVKDLTDDQMLRGMINENSEMWHHGTAYFIESVWAAKKYIDEELAKYENWEDLQEFLRVLFVSDHAVKQAKELKNGVGEPIIKKYLGNALSKEKIRQSLAILRSKDVDLSAVKTFKKLNHAHAFMKALQKFPAPKPSKQKQWAKEIKQEHGDKITKPIIQSEVKKKLVELIETEEGEEGLINRVALLKALKLLKPALDKKSSVVAMGYFYLMDDKIMADNDWIWTTISFPIGVTGLVKAVALDSILSISTEKMIDLSLSDDGKTLQITGDDIDSELPILVDEEYCATITESIPRNSDWHELPNDLFTGLEFVADFASSNFASLDFNSIYVKAGTIYAIDEFTAALYQLQDAVNRDFSIPKFQVDAIKSYFNRSGKFALKFFKVDLLESEEGMGFKEIIHFKGDNISVSIKSRGNSEFAEGLEIFFLEEQEDYREGVELPKELISTLAGFNRLLKESIEFEDDRFVILNFSEGQLSCSATTEDGEFVSKEFHGEIRFEDQAVSLRLCSLQKIMKKARQLINIDYEKDVMEFGNESFRLFIKYVQRIDNE